MKIGCVKEIKRHEYRVGTDPSLCQSLCIPWPSKCTIQIRLRARDAGFEDAEYAEGGSHVIEADRKRDLRLLRHDREGEGAPEPRSTISSTRARSSFTYLHLAADREQTDALLARKNQGRRLRDDPPSRRDPALPEADERDRRPPLRPGGREVPREALRRPRRPFRRRARRAARQGLPSSAAASSGMNAAKMAVGLGAQVVVLDLSSSRLAYLDDIFRGQLWPPSTPPRGTSRPRSVAESDLVIGAVLVPGAQGTRSLVQPRACSRLMKKRSVIVDVAVGPRRLRRDDHDPDHPRPAHLRGRRRRALLRRQHARRGLPHEHPRPHELDPGLRPQDRRPRAGGGPQRRSPGPQGRASTSTRAS